ELVVVGSKEVLTGGLEHVTDGAVTVLGREGQSVALHAEEVGQEEAGRSRPAVGVTRMTLGHGVGEARIRRGDRVVVVAAAVVVDRAADGRITPLLVDAQVDHRIPEVGPGVVDRLTAAERAATTTDAGARDDRGASRATPVELGEVDHGPRMRTAHNARILER